MKRIGLSEAGLWVTATNNSVAEFRPGSVPLFLWPVLEWQLEEFRSLLKVGLRAKGLRDSIAEEFPWEAIVVTALKDCSEYWTKLALEWIPQIPITPSIRAALQEVARNGPSQAIRHSALQRFRK
jgi:hypothetical protein